ncbi:hypothetical protein, partial [Marinisporobacter balticus]|uniref:hypothetical protein n=1 Tax=Marinisporobacter balticus TaxID=2018667 RepID=UPI001A9BD773
VLGTPPAFILSQDQTLKIKSLSTFLSRQQSYSLSLITSVAQNKIFIKILSRQRNYSLAFIISVAQNKKLKCSFLLL